MSKNRDMIELYALNCRYTEKNKLDSTRLSQIANISDLLIESYTSNAKFNTSADGSIEVYKESDNAFIIKLINKNNDTLFAFVAGRPPTDYLLFELWRNTIKKGSYEDYNLWVNNN